MFWFNNNLSKQIKKLRKALDSTDAVLIGAGAGLSTAAGYTYSGDRFNKYFADFESKYGFSDMYSGGFYPYETLEEYWAFWSRNIYYNRYDQPESEVYKNLLRLVKDKNYFVLTTNVDHLFQNNGFDKKKLFYTQGDFGLFQCSKPCHNKTYDNEQQVRNMIKRQENLKIPEELIPYCPVCGEPMTMNLRIDNTFVEDEGWHKANENYKNYLQQNMMSKILYLELGVGMNTPGIIKYPFWSFAIENPHSVFASISLEKNFIPENLERQSICIEGDIKEVLERLTEATK